LVAVVKLGRAFRRFGLGLALAGYCASSTGLSLALHHAECAKHDEHHDPLDCLQNEAVHAGFGALPAPTPALACSADAPPVLVPELAAQPAISIDHDVAAPRGPPQSHPVI
jgi:hypothetical protein